MKTLLTIFFIGLSICFMVGLSSAQESGIDPSGLPSLENPATDAPVVILLVPKPANKTYKALRKAFSLMGYNTSDYKNIKEGKLGPIYKKYSAITRWKTAWPAKEAYAWAQAEVTEYEKGSSRILIRMCYEYVHKISQKKHYLEPDMKIMLTAVDSLVQRIANYLLVSENNIVLLGSVTGHPRSRRSFEEFFNARFKARRPDESDKEWMQRGQSTINAEKSKWQWGYPIDLSKAAAFIADKAFSCELSKLGVSTQREIITENAFPSALSDLTVPCLGSGFFIDEIQSGSASTERIAEKILKEILTPDFLRSFGDVPSDKSFIVVMTYLVEAGEGTYHKCYPCILAFRYNKLGQEPYIISLELMTSGFKRIYLAHPQQEPR